MTLESRGRQRLDQRLTKPVSSFAAALTDELPVRSHTLSLEMLYSEQPAFIAVLYVEFALLCLSWTGTTVWNSYSASNTACETVACLRFKRRLKTPNLQHDEHHPALYKAPDLLTY